MTAVSIKYDGTLSFNDLTVAVKMQRLKWTGPSRTGKTLNFLMAISIKNEAVLPNME